METYHVPIPSIENIQVLKYLRSNGLLTQWETIDKETGAVLDTERPTYYELIEKVDGKCKWDEDRVFEWHEQKYNERGQPVGTVKQKYFNVHAYGRMMHQINTFNNRKVPGKNILQQLNAIGKYGKHGFNETIYSGTEPREKPYIEKHIETVDVMFRNIVNLTFIMYEQLQEENRVDDILQKENDNTRRTIKRVQVILSSMLWKYPTLIIHIPIEKAFQISLSYDEDRHKWDSWYVRQLLYHAPFFFQRPYWSKTSKIKEEHRVYLYHMFTYQSQNRNGEYWALDNKEIHELCGTELDRIKYLTPPNERQHFNKLTRARQALTRQAFGDNESINYSTEHQQFVGVVVGLWIEKKLTPFQIKMKTVKAWQDQFQDRFGYKLDRNYLIQCIDAEMKTVDWWKDADTTRLRRGKTTVGRKEAERESIPITQPSRPVREGVKKVIPATVRKTLDEVGYDSSGGSDVYESDTSYVERPAISKKIIWKEDNYDSGGGSDVYSSDDSNEEDETKSDYEEQVGVFKSRKVYDISDDDLPQDTQTLKGNERKARQWITDYIYTKDLLGPDDPEQAKWYTGISKTNKALILKGIEQFKVDNASSFLDEIIRQYKNGTYDGMTLNNYNASRRKRGIWKENVRIKQEFLKQKQRSL